MVLPILAVRRVFGSEFLFFPDPAGLPNTLEQELIEYITIVFLGARSHCAFSFYDPGSHFMILRVQ